MCQEGWGCRSVFELTRFLNTIVRSLCAAASRELFQSDCEDDSCMDIFAKCGGSFFNVSTSCCDPAASCVVKNYFYAQCLTEEKAGTIPISKCISVPPGIF